MFERPTIDEPLSQGDLVDECPLFALTCSKDDVNLDADPTRWRGRAIVITQACDLANVKTTRAVVAVVHAADALVEQGVLAASLIRDRVRRHQVFGWYFLPEHREVSFPESIVDLRNLHTIPRVALEALIADERRICRLASPYRKHLAQHFATTYARIGLPEPYETSP